MEEDKKKRLISLALAEINRDTTISYKKLAAILPAILLAVKGRSDFSIDDLSSILVNDGPYAIRHDVIPPPSGNVSPVARTVTRIVTKRNPKRNPKNAFIAAQRFNETHNTNNSGGKKTQKKGQRTHRRKKNTSRSLYTIK